MERHQIIEMIEREMPVQMSDLKANCIHNEHDSLPQDMQHFDFSICVGLLYHLKNPYAFIESLARITRYCIVGTWIFTQLSPARPISRNGGWPICSTIANLTAIQRIIGSSPMWPSLVFSDAAALRY